MVGPTPPPCASCGGRACRWLSRTHELAHPVIASAARSPSSRAEWAWTEGGQGHHDRTAHQVGIPSPAAVRRPTRAWVEARSGAFPPPAPPPPPRPMAASREWLGSDRRASTPGGPRCRHGHGGERCPGRCLLDDATRIMTAISSVRSGHDAEVVVTRMTAMCRSAWSEPRSRGSAPGRDVEAGGGSSAMSRRGAGECNRHDDALAHAAGELAG